MDKIIKIRAIRIGVAGDWHVGKASLCQTYTENETHLNDYPNVGIIRYEKAFKSYKVIIFCSCRQERYRSADIIYLKYLGLF